MRARLARLCLLTLAMGWSLMAHTAQGQEPTTPQEPAPRVSREVIRVFLDRIEVVGRVDKPQAIFIIPGKNPEVEGIRIDRMFFREIFRKVEYPTGVLRRSEEVVRKEYILW